MIQAEGRIEGCAAGACDHFEDVEPLTNAEIDELCESINLRPAHDGTVTVKIDRALLGDVLDEAAWSYDDKREQNDDYSAEDRDAMAQKCRSIGEVFGPIIPGELERWEGIAHAIEGEEDEVESDDDEDSSECDCGDRSWYGQVHDTACPLAGQPKV